MPQEEIVKRLFLLFLFAFTAGSSEGADSRRPSIAEHLKNSERGVVVVNQASERACFKFKLKPPGEFALWPPELVCLAPSERHALVFHAIGKSSVTVIAYLENTVNGVRGLASETVQFPSGHYVGNKYVGNVEYNFNHKTLFYGAGDDAGSLEY